VLLSNLGLTVFVRLLSVDLVKQVLWSALIGEGGDKRVKGIETSMVFSVFVP
jgi:hypothetical protein